MYADCRGYRITTLSAEAAGALSLCIEAKRRSALHLGASHARHHVAGCAHHRVSS